MTKVHELTIETLRAGPGLVDRAIAAMETYGQRRRQRRELAELLERDDHLLRDLGVNRAEVLRETRKPFWIA